MDHLSSLLQKIKDRLGIEEEKIGVVLEIIKETTKMSLSKETITIKKGVVIVTTSPTIKMALLSKKDQIIKECIKRGVSVASIR